MQPNAPNRSPPPLALAAWALPLLVPALFFHRAVLSDGLFLARDMLRVCGPLLDFWVERLRQGHWPEWYPYDGLGQPFTGMVVSRPFHPANLLAFVLPVFTSLKVTTLVCFPLAWVGASRLARCLGAQLAGAVVAGLCFCFCGYLVTITNDLPYLLSATTVPWALAAVERCRTHPSSAQVVRAGFLLVLVLFAGDIQAFAITCALALALPWLQAAGPARRALFARAALSVVLAGLLAVVQLVPAAMARQEGRFGQQTLAEATAWSTHPLRLAELALGPLFAGPERASGTVELARELLHTDREGLWAQSLYAGTIPVLLAAVGLWAWRRNRRALGVAAASALLLILAFGRFGGLYAVVFKLLPMWRAFRYPEKLMPLVSLGLALGAGAGWQALQADDRLRRRAAFGCGVLAALALAAWAWIQGSAFIPRALEAALGAGEDAVAAQRMLVTALTHSLGRIAIATLLLGIGLAVIRNPLHRTMFVLALIAGDLYLANEPYYRLASPEVVEQPPALAEEIKEDQGGAIQPGSPRVYRMTGNTYQPRNIDLSMESFDALQIAAGLEPVAAALSHLGSPEIHLPAASRRVNALFWSHQGEFAEKVAPRFNTAYFVLPQELAAAGQAHLGRPLARIHLLGMVLFRSDRALPRSYLARPSCVRDQAQALEAFRAEGFMAGREAIVECPRPLQASDAPDLGTAQIRSYEPDQVELAVDAKAPSLLVLNDAFYRGWSATVDGAETEILPTNVAVRGVMVAAGHHQVVFRYQTPGLKWAALISLLSAVGALGVGLYRRFQS